jgi:hypothetical protein
MINESANNLDFIENSEKNKLHVYYLDNYTCDSSRTQTGNKILTQRRVNKLLSKKKVIFSSPMVEIIDVECYKSWTKSMYIMPCHDAIISKKDSCCDGIVCIIV